MSLDRSRAKGIVKRFLREEEESAWNGIEYLRKKIRVGKKLSFYEELYTGAVIRPFIDVYAGGTNNYSFALLLHLSKHSVQKGEDAARGDWDEDLAFLYCHHIDHRDCLVSHGPSPHVSITLHCIQRIYQRFFADEVTAEDICVRQVLDQLKGVSTYADMWLSLLSGFPKKPDRSLEHLSIPIPSDAGLLLCKVLDGPRLSVNTFVPNERLRSKQKRAKRMLDDCMKPFLDSMLRFKHVRGKLHPDRSRRDLHFRDMDLLERLFDFHVHENFNPEECLEFHEYKGGGDERRALSRIAKAMKNGAESLGGRADGMSESRLGEMLDDYLELGERRFLQKWRGLASITKQRKTDGARNWEGRTKASASPQRGLEFEKRIEFDLGAISPFLEMGAYEEICLRQGIDFRSLAKRFLREPEKSPSDIVSEDGMAYARAEEVSLMMREKGVERFGVQMHGVGEYPARLRDARHPVELVYYQGQWDLTSSPCVAVVGTRNPSNEGLSRTRSIVRDLVGSGYTIVSGLASGIDRMAHMTAMEEGGRTIAVIGTPISHAYPKENRELQREIADRFLVVSQVPVMRWYRNRANNHPANRWLFLERNITMSALAEATIIVEAGERSGTIAQANAALQQGRSLFIADECCRNPHLTWPEKLIKEGAVRMRSSDDILERLPQKTFENGFRKRLVKIDELTLPDHEHLTETDDCCFLREWRKRGHQGDGTAIHRLMSGIRTTAGCREGDAEKAMEAAANALRDVLVNGDAMEKYTLVPIPHSDGRMTKAAKLTHSGLDVRELLDKEEGDDGTRTSRKNPPSEEIKYSVNERQASPEPRHIVIIDDLLVKGTRYRAAKEKLSERFPSAKISGLFIARLT